MARPSESVKVADECWIALALLHREHPKRASFSATEVLDRLRKEKVHPELRSGIQPHIYQHNVANLAPNSARYRMFYRLDDGTLRLYRPGDISHYGRTGKTSPILEALPDRYRGLLKWYEADYCAGQSRDVPLTDRLLAARGLGREIWEKRDSDRYVQELRSEWVDDKGHEDQAANAEARSKRNEEVWKRVKLNEGELFHTVRGGHLTYEVEGNSGLWFFRDGRKINKRLSRSDVNKALDRCPLHKITDISDCIDSSYLFALLNDDRIRKSDW